MFKRKVQELRVVSDIQWNAKVSDDIVVLAKPLAHTSEAIRRVQSQLQRRFIDQGIRSFAIVGDDPRSGSSFVTANLAVSCAQSGRRTVLVDANLGQPRQSLAFGLDPTNPGLADWLESDEYADFSRYGSLRLPNLTVIPAGRGSLADLLQQPKLGAIMAQLSRTFDVVVCDAPPASDLANSLAVAGIAERTVLVGRQHFTPVATLQRLQSLIAQCHGRVEGVILVQH